MSDTTIRNCSRKSGFVFERQAQKEEQEESVLHEFKDTYSKLSNKVDNLPPSEDYLSIEEDLCVWAPVTESGLHLP